jgi:hypothetical protein
VLVTVWLLALAVVSDELRSTSMSVQATLRAADEAGLDTRGECLYHNFSLTLPALDYQQSRRPWFHLRATNCLGFEEAFCDDAQKG